MHPRATTDDRGASAAEYSILIAGIAAVIILAVIGLGNATSTTYTDYNDCFAARGIDC